MTALSPSDLKGKVQTVTGLVAPQTLGAALMHEHLFIDLNPPKFRTTPLPDGVSDAPIDLCNCFRARYGQGHFTDNYRIDDFAVVRHEVEEMQRAGGRTLVDLTVGGLGPRPLLLRRMAEETGVQLVMGCGHYVEEYQMAETAEMSVDALAAQMTAQILEGAWGTDVRAGIIGEIGCQTPWTDREKRVMEGAIAAQKATGAALNVHPGREPHQPQEVVDFVTARGGAPERLILSHIDRTIFDDDTLFRLADTGCMIEYDLFGWEDSYYWPNPDIDLPNDAMRVRWLRKLAERGHLDQILISHDVCTKGRLEQFGGHGFQHIFANVVPLLLRRGFTQGMVDRILIDNPARLLTFV
ncbi:aryldialkylphosphatase [Pseudooceanicola sediminis]|uniref:Aryldialkylphosphatase n=1 Tax=Pseudooceanicola sediminis TaxID=2211117 RepID=A0A399IVA7_9RHOB|nr:aryldialkylphosphatase [Pseudooceanicola sediminis]KAA2311566.1 aryldialkylphosphatase [Puniceibacterium sp. HSS470]RII37063.1 aryldialkylphosphatase [Pseudooceanicola sediminis]|tara:strand:- start:19535 stop:20596 length:1062 start_codon:yes stop_codon:yes gene_type:complete